MENNIIFYYEEFLDTIKNVTDVYGLITDFLASVEIMEFNTEEERLNNCIHIMQEKDKISNLAFLLKEKLLNEIEKNQKIINEG